MDYFPLLLSSLLIKLFKEFISDIKVFTFSISISAFTISYSPFQLPISSHIAHLLR